MKKLVSLFVFITLVFGLLEIEVYAKNSNTQYFVVTAYYSPLPNQNFYLKGNYQAELRLNGKGIAGASGKKVFPGMLAAPKNYIFGTKIHLEGLGTGSVEDRGGAIVNAGNRGYKNDRIDVWMGYGDEGLRRALYWGKRTVKGTFLSRNSQVNLDINKISTPLWATKNLKKSVTNPKIVYQNNSINDDLELFNKYIYLNSNKTDITLLQKTLKELSLYNGELTGKYDDVLNIVTQYQISKNILINSSSYGAGYFGPKTRKVMKRDYENYLLVKRQEEEKENYLTNEINNLKNISEKEVTTAMSFIGKPIFGDITPQVRELQLILKKLGHFDYNDTAIFGKITKEAIIDFQLTNNIILSEDDNGSGVFGPKTRKAFEIVLKKQILDELVLEKGFDSDEIAKILKLKI